MSAVVITGMHRSGTSALARMVSALGVASGDPELLMKAAPSNRHGHFEFLPVVDLNDEILRILGSHWSGPTFDPTGLDALVEGELGKKARSLINDSFDPGKPFFLKDPRFCLLWPFWRRILDDPPLIVALRHPSEVARSLEKRDDLPLGFGVALWHEYLRRLLASTDGAPSLLVRYEHMLSDSEATTARVSAFLEANLDSFDPSVADFAPIDPSARTAVATDSDIAGLAPVYSALWRLLDSHPVDALQLPFADEPAIAGSDLLFEVRAQAGPLVDQGVDANSLRAQIDSMSGAIASMNEEHHALVTREANLLREVAEVTGKLYNFREHHNNREAAWHTERQSLERDLGHVRGEFDSAQAARHSLEVFEKSRAGRVVRSYWRLADKAKNAVRASRSDDPVELPHHLEPLVSIVIPVYGQLPHTIACLESIRDNTTTPYEVIVVDDVSPDESREFLRRCGGLVLVENEENLGYLRSTNAGAELARAPFLCLLNNDTTVTAGWLEELTRLALESDDIGAVGSKLVYPDGRLQEAGAIVWSDGSGWNWGRGGDPQAWEVNFVREVDYCSAASLLVRRDAFKALGGFDERYTPAYYEDTDLAFGLRQSGYRVLYQPTSVVIHHEGVSHGTDETSGLKAHQVINRDRFVGKWEAALAEQRPSDSPPRLAVRHGTAPRILIVDHEVPAQDKDSGSLRMTAIVELLVEAGFTVTFVPHNRQRREPYASMLQSLGVEVFYGHADFDELIRTLAADLCLAWVARPTVATDLLPRIRLNAPDVPIVYDMVDFHGLRLARSNETEGNVFQTTRDYATTMTEFERALVRSSDIAVAITEDERQIVAELEPEAVLTVLANIHRAPLSRTPFAHRRGLLFVGSWQHLPNRDAIAHLTEEIMPLVWNERPDMTVRIVGSDFPDDLGAGMDSRVEIVGWVDDLTSVFDETRFSVAPLRFGAGLKGKVGDSLMRGVPVVTTSIGAEGFQAAKEAVHIADTAESFADVVLSVYDDESDWQRRATAGRSTVSRLFGYDAARASLNDIFARLNVNAPGTADV